MALNNALGQTQTYYTLSPAVAGDWASSNPRQTVLAGPGGFVAGASGVTVGAFAWASASTVDPNGAPAIVNSFGSGAVTGFCARLQQGLITAYLSDASMTIPAGFPVTLMDYADVWVVNSGSTQALFGQKAYANFANGLISFAATGSASTSTATTFSISAQTFSVTASVTGNVMTVSTVGSGTLYPGAVLSSAAASATILSQTSGTTGGTGTYTVSVPEQSVASTTITGTYGLLTLGGTITGTFPLGASITGTSVPTGATITANATNGASLTGAGGAGTYVTLTGTASSGTLTGATNIETSWYARSTGNAGELVKISHQALG
jgi:hypothetical protein